MTTQHLILAHDLGTTGNKASLFDVNGATVASTFASYPTDYPYPNWAEQNPADWQAAIFGATRDLLAMAGVSPAQVAVVSFSGHMQGALVVDKNGVPLRPAIIWADQRATAQANLLADTLGADQIYQLTGNRVSPAYTAAKLRWIQDNQPQIYRRIYKVLQAKDYAAFLFCGQFATDYSDASLTQLLNLEQQQWSPEILGALQFSVDLLPALQPSATVIGQVTPQAAQTTGLLAGTPVVIGAGDGGCASVGAGAVAEGDIYNYIGSSSWVALTTTRPVFDPAQRTFNFIHPDPQFYCPLGTMQAAGGAYDWLERLFRADGSAAPQHKELDDAAAKVAPGANGLLFLPYLLGERSPYWNPQARAAFLGLAMPDSQAQMARAALEGVAFNLRIILDSLRGQGVQAQHIRLIGGGSKSPVWRQILADVYNLPLALVSLPAAATGLGAAIAGGVGVGLFADYGVVRQLVPATLAETPNPATRARYEALYELFKQSYAALEPIYRQLANLPD